MRFAFLLLLQLCLFGVDYDCILIGTSPFSLFEALYQSHSGKKVLILEEAAECGGAWKSISICGVPHADLGCHLIGNNELLKEFLEEYAGCSIVSMDNPLLSYNDCKSTNGYYFSHGCHELIDHLLQLIAATDIVLLTNHKAENVTIDPDQKIAWIETKDQRFSTSKLIVTPMSCLPLIPSSRSQIANKSKYWHLYMLIQDATPPRFTYQNNHFMGASRMMNLTHFVDLNGTGRQLVVVQTHQEPHPSFAESFLEKLKEDKWVDPGAYILKTEPYLYESGFFHQGQVGQMGAQNIIEILQTGHLQSLANYIPRWKKILMPYALTSSKN